MLPIFRKNCSDIRVENIPGTFVFDFDRMNAFSVERTVVENDFETDNRLCEVTIIGYIHNNEVGEWVVRCTLDQHQVIAKDFKKWLDSNKDNNIHLSLEE